MRSSDAPKRLEAKQAAACLMEWRAIAMRMRLEA